MNREGVRESGLRERALARRLRAHLAEVAGIRLYGPADPRITCAPIIPVAVKSLPSREVARILDREFGIAVRAGLQCAPEAHRVTGTLETRLTCLSIGHTTSETDVDTAAEALIDIASRPAAYWLTQWEGRHAR